MGMMDKVRQLFDCRKLTKTVNHLKMLSPEYDNVLDAIYRDIKARYDKLYGLYMQCPAKALREEMKEIRQWLRDNPR